MKKEITVFGIIVIVATGFSSIVSAENPPKPSELNVYINDHAPHVGETVHVTISEIPYEGEGEMQFSVDVYYGKNEDYRFSHERDYILDHWIDPTKPNGWIYNLKEGITYSTNVSFIPEKEGVVTIYISCHRRYDVTSESIEINVLSNPDSESLTPGFEIFLFICAISLSIFIWTKRKSKK